MTEPSPTTAYLGRYDEFEADLVMDILQEAGIFAFHKHRPTDNDHFAYSPILESDRGVIMVDAGRVAEAKTLVAEELPKHLSSIAEAMETLDVEESDGD